MVVNLLKSLWKDDRGAIITAEYLMLFSVLVLGAAQGLTTLRDSTNQEMQDVAKLARDTRIANTPGLPKAAGQTQPADQQPASKTAAPPCIGSMCP